MVQPVDNPEVRQSVSGDSSEEKILDDKDVTLTAKDTSSHKNKAVDESVKTNEKVQAESIPYVSIGLVLLIALGVLIYFTRKW